MGDTEAIVVGDVEVRPHERSVLVRGDEVPLTPGEFEIVLMLAEHPGWVFSAGQLAGDSDTGDHSPESVSVLVSRLRQKLLAVGVVDAVETVRGFGYRLRCAGGETGAIPATESTRRALLEAAWQLQEAVIEVEHAGTAGQQSEAAEVLEEARRAVWRSMAEQD